MTMISTVLRADACLINVRAFDLTTSQVGTCDFTDIIEELADSVVLQDAVHAAGLQDPRNALPASGRQGQKLSVAYYWKNSSIDVNIQFFNK